MAASFSINRQWLSPPSGDMKIEGREGLKLCVGTDGLALRARGASQTYVRLLHRGRSALSWRTFRITGWQRSAADLPVHVDAVVSSYWISGVPLAACQTLAISTTRFLPSTL